MKKPKIPVDLHMGKIPEQDYNQNFLMLPPAEKIRLSNWMRLEAVRQHAKAMHLSDRIKKELDSVASVALSKRLHDFDLTEAKRKRYELITALEELRNEHAKLHTKGMIYFGGDFAEPGTSQVSGNPVERAVHKTGRIYEDAKEFLERYGWHLEEIERKKLKSR